MREVSIITPAVFGCCFVLHPSSNCGTIDQGHGDIIKRFTALAVQAMKCLNIVDLCA